ncbi:MAG: fibrinogen-related protein [Cyanobacteria bacterium J06649_11]
MSLQTKRNIVITITIMTFFVLYEASSITYTLISKDKTLSGITPYDSENAPDRRLCISRCTYDPECLTFDFTPGSSGFGTCNFYDVAFKLSDKEQSLSLSSTPGTNFYSVVLKSDCAEYKKQGFTQSRVYRILALGKHKLRVFCNMEEDGGGWIVFQRRFDGSVSFARTWNKYRDGMKIFFHIKKPNHLL